MSARSMVDAVVRRAGGPNENGYVAVVTALIFSTLAFGFGALAVDAGRLWVESERVQKAADFAALGAVTYMPSDLPTATTTARDVAERNGFPNSGTSTVTVAQGAQPSQLRVTVCSTVENNFGAVIGFGHATVCRAALADFTGPAPMGSPCNTFGNEPNAGTGAAAPTGSAQGSSPYANCPTNPKVWGVIEGPEVKKDQGDRYMVPGCPTAVTADRCTGTVNDDYDPAGYFFLVRVQPAAVGKTIDLQLYDAVFAPTVTTDNSVSPPLFLACGGLPASSNWPTTSPPTIPNPYAADPKARYVNSATSAGSTGAPYCSGDYFPGGGSNQMITSFGLRQQTDTLDPSKAPVQNDTSGKPCIKQYVGQTSAPTVNTLSTGNAAYNDQFARTFHNWVSMCSFIPSRAGDYYLQVRTNISLTGASSAANSNSLTPDIYSDNTNVVTSATGNYTSGHGANSFSIRAVTPSGFEKSVSVSGYDRMPVYANADAATSTFNLIRVVPGGAGKSINFSFFDAGDASASGSVKVLLPTDAKNASGVAFTTLSTSTQFPRGGCLAKGGNAGSGATYTDCSAPITNTANNAKLETLSIPIPNDYNCDYTLLSGCWYRVQVTFATGTVHDVTTWTANVFGDPVRLLE